jgi:hypothetical protein
MAPANIDYNTAIKFTHERVGPMKAVIAGSLVVLVGTLSGCSLPYDIAQDHAMDQCNKMVDFGERQACLKRIKTTLENYDKKREQQIEADRKANAR